MIMILFLYQYLSSRQIKIISVNRDFKIDVYGRRSTANFKLQRPAISTPKISYSCLQFSAHVSQSSDRYI